ncbi:MAG: alpha/beta fold hydrolase [Leptospira sp.]|nr:alpha/beta fold hydrolase [Leptospira sp.]
MNFNIFRTFKLLILGFLLTFTVNWDCFNSSKDTQEGIIRSVDGTPIFFKKVGSGTPVVVLHGGPGLDHNYLVAHLSQTIGAGKQLIFFDQRGTGLSGGSVGSSDLNANFINKDKFLQDLDAIRVQLGLGEKINILGHSWGGLYAMLYATDNKYKNNVKSLALVGSAGAHHSYYGQFLNNLIDRATLQNVGIIVEKARLLTPNDSNFSPSSNAFKDYYDFTFKFYFADYNSNIGKSQNSQSLRFNSPSDRTIHNGLAVSSLINSSLIIDTAAYGNLQGPGIGNSNLNLTTQLRNINYPVLLVHGKKDLIPSNFIIGNDALSVQANLRMGGKATIKARLIADSGHFPFIEQPTAFTEAFEGFYNNL